MGNESRGTLCRVRFALQVAKIVAQPGLSLRKAAKSERVRRDVGLGLRSPIQRKRPARIALIPCDLGGLFEDAGATHSSDGDRVVDLCPQLER